MRTRLAPVALTALIALIAACGAGTRAPVTFVLKNSHTQELAFNMDRGWQPNLFAYTGKPPRAKWILMFPKHCTASCEAAAEGRCPTCREPERPGEELAAQKFAKVAPGDELEVPWDGRAFVYEDTRGRRRHGKPRTCQCHRKKQAPPGTYTVKACGLRLTRTAGQVSQLQCVEAKMKLPPAAPLRIELDFGAPAGAGRHVARATR